MDYKDKKYKILLTGGGSGGSVAPLLAVFDELTSPQPSPWQGEGAGFEFLWLGTKFGPEREMVKPAGIKFKAISGGKWRRYFSFKNLLDLFLIKLGFWQAVFIMLKWRPDLVMSAGSFVSVPVVWAAWFLRVPVLIHQQDILPGLANKLMAPFAKIVTVTFENSLKDYGQKAVWTGNPTRRSLEFPISNFSASASLRRDGQFPNINYELPVVLILGGGTGALAINKLMAESLGELTKFCQIIHVTGKNKSKKLEVSSKNYEVFEFLDAEKMAAAMKLAEVVMTRAGMSFLSELSYLAKPVIIIPMPESHQQANADYFKNNQAAVVVEQKYLAPANFIEMIKALLLAGNRREQLAKNIKQAMKPGANQAMVKIIKGILK